MTKTYKLDLNIGDEIQLKVNAPDPLDPRYRQVIDTMIAAMGSPADPTPPAPVTIIQREPWLREELHLIAGAAGTGDMAVSTYRAAFPHSQRTDKAIKVKHAILHPNRDSERGIVRQKRPPLNNPDDIIPSDAHINARMQWSKEEDDIIRQAGCVSHAVSTYRAAFPNSKRTDKGISIRYDRLATPSAPPTVSIMITDKPVLQEPLSTGMEVTLHDPVPEPAPPSEPIPNPEAAPAPVTHDPADLPDTLLRHLLVSISSQDAIDRYRQQYRGPKPYSDTDIRILYKKLGMPIRIGVMVETRVGLGKDTLCGKIKRIERNDPMYVVVDCKKEGSITIDPVSIYRENRIIRPQSPEIQDDPPGLSSHLSSQVAA